MSHTMMSDEEEDDFNLCFEESPTPHQEEPNIDMTQLTQRPISNPGTNDNNSTEQNNNEDSLLLEIGHSTQSTQGDETNQMREWSTNKVSKYACFRCEFITNSDLSFRRHILRHIQKDDNCTTCKSWLDSGDILTMMEDWKKPSKKRNHLCSQCGFKSVSALGLKIHMRVHKKRAI